MSAMAKVLNLPELLKNILVQVPMYDLLLHTQLVCKSWHDFIQTSPRIRRILFFELLPGQPLAFSVQPQPHSRLDGTRHKSRRIRLFKLLGYYQLPLANPSKAAHLDYMWTLPSPAPRIPVPIVVNPVLTILVDLVELNIRNLFSEKLSALPESWQRPEASWRRMFMTDRPITGRLRIRVEEEGEEGYSVKKTMASSKDWKLGKMFDWGKKGLAKWAKVDRNWYCLDTYHISVEGMELWEDCDDHGMPAGYAGGRDPLGEDDDDENDSD